MALWYPCCRRRPPPPPPPLPPTCGDCAVNGRLPSGWHISVAGVNGAPEYQERNGEDTAWAVYWNGAYTLDCEWHGIKRMSSLRLTTSGTCSVISPNAKHWVVRLMVYGDYANTPVCAVMLSDSPRYCDTPVECRPGYWRYIATGPIDLMNFNRSLEFVPPMNECPRGSYAPATVVLSAIP